uniref:Uncharacterized protein n=1 Tax=Tanacetum cinerariifolium TaxID=118510 RepID=A0A6L2NFA7_TANCI|nr:hypothetical protein [Tanacetum cinerariifolium]
MSPGKTWSHVLLFLVVIPMMAFSKDGMSAIATKLDTPLMLDSYTSDMCMQSLGNSNLFDALNSVSNNDDLGRNEENSKLAGKGSLTVADMYGYCKNHKKRAKKRTKTDTRTEKVHKSWEFSSFGQQKSTLVNLGASTTPIYSSGSSSTPINSQRASRNAECSNCKHLLDKITVLEAMHLQKIYNGKKAALKERYWVPEEDGTYDMSASDANVPRTFQRIARLVSRENSIDINQWIQEIAVSFRHLKSLHIRHMHVHDSDLELLARTCGRDLRVLKIRKCKGFSTDGLLHIGRYCNDFRTLCLKGNQFNNKDGKWLHELALQNTGIESLDFRYFHIHDVKDLTLLAKNCCRSLVSLKIAAVVDLINLVDVFRHVVRLEDFVGGEWVEDQVYAGFKFPTSMRCVGIDNLTESSFPFFLPCAHQLRELHLIDVYLDDNSPCLLIQSCPNLEVLYTDTVFGDMGLKVIGQFCKKLRKFKTDDWATQTGLIAMVKGCLELECLHIKLTGISNEILECIGTHLKNLRDFHMTKGYLSLGHLGESAAAGLVCLSKGCPKLRKLEIQSFPFSKETLAPILYDMHMLRYMSVRDVNNITLAMTHPNFQP